MIEFYGTEDTKEIPDEYSGVSKLREVTFILNREELKTIIEFLINCQNEYENNENWDHKHLVDHLFKIGYDGPDLIVYGKN